MKDMTRITVVFVGIAVLMATVKAVIFEIGRKARRRRYNEDYLTSDEWQRKRALVLKRDHWRCVHCGARATQVHHTKYARRNIGREPIEWLVSVCEECHSREHERT